VDLHLIEPLGFRLNDTTLKRAGMDYWQYVRWHRWRDWSRFTATVPASSVVWFIESGGPRLYTEATYGPADYLVFGRETAGMPEQIIDRQRWVRIPMFNPSARSLNLSNCVALVLFEALRQQGFPGEIRG
jgi:tRNA (cytidine/uridine-2'-O-)-methyltransferase